MRVRSPRSVSLIVRELTPDSSASCSCVNPVASRSEQSRAPSADTPPNVVTRRGSVGNSVSDSSWSATPQPATVAARFRDPEETMNPEQTKQLARRLYDLINAADVQAAGDLVTVDYVEHDPLPGQG